MSLPRSFYLNICKTVFLGKWTFIQAVKNIIRHRVHKIPQILQTTYFKFSDKTPFIFLRTRIRKNVILPPTCPPAPFILPPFILIAWLYIQIMKFLIQKIVDLLLSSFVSHPSFPPAPYSQTPLVCSHL